MSERIMSAGRGMLAWKRPDPPARSLRIDPETGWPLSWIITRTETFSSDKPAEQVLSLDCGHQIKTKAERSQEVPQMVVCRECHKNRPKLAQVLTALGKPHPHQLYLREQIIADWKGAEEGYRFAVIGGSPSERTLALLWAIAAAIECGARMIGAVHWLSSAAETSDLHRFITNVYGPPAGGRWKTAEATILMMSRSGDPTFCGVELDFVAVDEASEIASVVSRFRSNPERIVIAPRRGSRFASQWSLISVD